MSLGTANNFYFSESGQYRWWDHGQELSERGLAHSAARVLIFLYIHSTTDMVSGPGLGETEALPCYYMWEGYEKKNLVGPNI